MMLMLGTAELDVLLECDYGLLDSVRNQTAPARHAVVTLSAGLCAGTEDVRSFECSEEEK